MSKADRIRGMTDEKMAEYLAEELGDGIPTDFLAWLQEIDEGIIAPQEARQHGNL